MSNSIINRVSESGIVTIDLESFSNKEDIIEFDLKDFLFMELILKEKEFREALKNLNTEKYINKTVSVTCSTDAIIPVWAYMLVTSLLQPIAKQVYFGNKNDIIKKVMIQHIQQINPEDYRDQRVVVKGCGENPIPEEAFVEITYKLRPVAKSIMYGEPCSTVPVYKKPSV
jgi:protease II